MGDGDGRMVAELRRRQALLERLGRIQRALVDERPLHEVLDEVAEAACELLGDELAIIRRADVPGGPSELVAAVGVGEPGADEPSWPAGGVSERAMHERRVILFDPVAGGDPESLRAEFGDGRAAAGIAAPVVERGEVVGALAVASRDSERRYDAADQQAVIALAEHASLALNHAHAVDEARYEAFHDRLTGLPNRSLFRDRLVQALARAERFDTPIGVLFCDLDGFKTINDSLGHAAGDRLLLTVAKRIRDCVRPADTVARVGGDEFAVLLSELREAGDAARAAGRILKALEHPFELGAREVYANASIGIATGGDDADILLRDADLAMYRAKAEGRGRYAIFEPGLHAAIVERLDLELDLKRAIDRGELELAYQPVFSLRSGAVAGLEALLRWRHPARGVIEPERFVPLAEEIGQIIPLGRWVLETACRQAALWRARYPALPGLQVGVNVSAAQLRQPGFAATVAETLAESELEPAGLTLEITESVLMEDTEMAAGRLDQLKALGVELAIDDFGIGYSSLTYLRRFPVDNLKIERAFIEGIGTEDEDPALLRAIIDLAEILGLRPVAEGIERQEQADRLLELGCDLGQGHLLSEPLSAADADALLLRVGLLGSPARNKDASVPSPADAAAARDRRAGNPPPGAPGGQRPG